MTPRLLKIAFIINARAGKGKVCFWFWIFFSQRRLRVQSAQRDLATNEEQLVAAVKRKNIPNIKLPADENGYAFIDKEKYPELYEWAVEEEWTLL